MEFLPQGYKISLILTKMRIEFKALVYYIYELTFMWELQKLGIISENRVHPNMNLALPLRGVNRPNYLNKKTYSSSNIDDFWRINWP